MRFYLAALALILLSCLSGGEPETSAVVVKPPAPAVQASFLASSEPPEPEPLLEAPAASEEVDPYEGWEHRCEPYAYDVGCQTTAECEGIRHVAQRPLRCVHPWWSDDPEVRICAPGYAHGRERKWRYARLRAMIGYQHFGERTHCELDGRPRHKEDWRCQRAMKRGDLLAQFLWVAYMRETTARPWKRHRLDADVRASKTTWWKQAETYGYRVEGDHLVATSDDANPHYLDRHRWHYGLGPAGQNAPLWVHRWDVQAPPEILCGEVEPFEAYLRKAREVVVQLKQGIRCGSEPYHNRKPTWTDLHHGVSQGSACPHVTAKQRKGLDRFRKHARKYGLDPDQVVTLKMLGEPIPREGQNETARDIYQWMDEQAGATLDDAKLD